MVEAEAEPGASHTCMVRFVVRDASEQATKRNHSQGCAAEGQCFIKEEAYLSSPVVIGGLFYVCRTPHGVQVLPVVGLQDPSTGQMIDVSLENDPARGAGSTPSAGCSFCDEASILRFPSEVGCDKTWDRPTSCQDVLFEIHSHIHRLFVEKLRRLQAGWAG